MDIIYNICKSLHATANAAKKKKKKDTYSEFINVVVVCILCLFAK